MFKFPAKMAGLKTSAIVLAMVLFSMAFLGEMAAAMQHHVAGDDKGWDVSSDLTAWASDRVFKVGDNIWFDNTASQESLVEVESVDEFSSCDLTNPIKMYTEDVSKVYLDGEGSRYFMSRNPESCKKGLKLHINVLPRKEDTHVDSSEYKDVTPEEKADSNPQGRDIPDFPEPPPAPSPKPKPPHKAAPPPEFDPDVGPDSPPEPFGPDVGPDKPPEPYYPPPKFPPPTPTPTPSSSTLLNGYFFAIVAAACWVAI